MRFDVLTLFPELFEPHLALGVTRRAFESGQVQVRLWPLREFGEGCIGASTIGRSAAGRGMVMLADPLERALEAVRHERGEAAPLVHFTPTGRPLTQALVREVSAGPGALLLCGRYEGIDQRFLDRHVDLEISLGDFVLSGGELPALALLDAVARLQPGVLNDAASHEQDSFSADGLLDCPHFSRPEAWSGEPVPAVLMSGHHAQIARWRRERSLELTACRRPELIAAARALGRLSKADEQFLAALTL